MYEVSCGSVPRKPWIEDDFIDINSIFINLELVERQDHRKVDHPEQFRDYTEIFDNEDFKKCKKCVISGDPGSGKTTLVSKIAFDWANQKLRQFDYVLVVKLREIASHGGLLCHLRNMYSESGAISILESGKHGPVLLILDGLDEMNQDLINSELGDILAGKMFPTVQLLITTRPHSLPVLKKYPHITLNVKGFRSQDIEMYIAKYFEGKNPDRASQVIMQCVTHNHLWNLVENPLCCLMLCFLYESRYADKPDNYTMPNNVTELYTELVEVFQEIYERKWASLNWNDLFKKLGLLAVEMLFVEKNGILIFEDKILQKYGIEPSEACRAGLVTRIESIKGQTSTGSSAVSQSKSMYYSFIHKSLQEFTAALYVLSCTQEQCTNLVSHIKDFDADTFVSLDLFIKFAFRVTCIRRRDGGFVQEAENICSMLLDKSTELLKSRSLDKDDTEDDVYQMMLEVCIENKSLLSQILAYDHRFQFLLAAFKVKSHFHVKERTQYHCVLSALVTQDIAEKLLDHGIHISMSELFFYSEPEVSAQEMSALIPFVNSFALASANLQLVEFKTMTQARDLTFIDLFQCKFINQTSLCEFLSFIYQCPKLHTLRVCIPVISEIGNPPQSESDMISMCSGNQPLPVKVLNLSGCPDTLTLVFLQQTLPLCTQLTSLTLLCDTSQDLHSIFMTLPCSLKVLQLTGSGFTEISVLTLLNQIDKLKSLELVSIGGIVIRITDIKNSQESTKVLCYGEKPYSDDIRQLSINLSQYCGDLDIIFQTLSKLSHRLDLNLTGFLIDNQMCRHIKSTATSIVGLNMRACRLDDLNPENVRETWKSLKHLKSLDLSMIKDQAAHLHDIFSMMPNSLEVLDVSGTDISQETLEHLSDFVRRKHFKKFEASGVLIQYDQATLYELSISLLDCGSFTSQILGHCLDKLHVSMLKLCGANKDCLIDREINKTVQHVLLSLDRLTLLECDAQFLKDFITHLCNSTQLREVNWTKKVLQHVESEFFSLLPSLPTSLEVLDLQHCLLPTNSVQCILKELCRFTQLRKLNLINNSLQHVESEFFLLLPSLPTSLEVLDLSWCRLTKNSAQCILKELCRFTHLRELNLSANSLGHVETVFCTLLPSLPTSLEVLDFSFCDLTTNSTQCILKELCRLTELRELNLSGSSLQHLESEFFILLPSLSTHLEVLDLSFCKLTTNSVKCILQELCRFTHLRELKLSWNSLEHVKSEFFLLLHSLSTYLEVLELSQCKLTTNSVQCILKELCRFTQLRKLNLSMNSLEHAESEFFSLLHSLPTSLEVLDLQECALTKNSFQCILKELCRCTQLRKLNLSQISSYFDERTFLSHLSINYRNITSVVQNILKTCRGEPFRKLKMSSNSLEHVESEFVLLLSSLPTSLEVLDLSHCYGTTNNIQCILKVLRRFTQLTELDLLGISLEHAESEFISTLPFLSVSLEVLQLYSCKLSTNCIVALMHQLPRLTHLKFLNITHNKLPDSGWQSVLDAVRELPPCGRVFLGASSCGISEDMKEPLKQSRQDIEWSIDDW